MRSTLVRFATITLLALPALAAAPAPKSATAQASASANELQKVLRQLDAASATFKSAEADFKWDFYEKIVRETTTQCVPLRCEGRF